MGPRAISDPLYRILGSSNLTHLVYLTEIVASTVVNHVYLTEIRASTGVTLSMPLASPNCAF
jgi:hypothetical protein